MLVLECYKHDVESQCTSLKLNPGHPKTPEPMVTKMFLGDYVPDTYRGAKFYYDLIREFCPHIFEIAYRVFTRLLLLGF